MAGLRAFGAERARRAAALVVGLAACLAAAAAGSVASARAEPRGSADDAEATLPDAAGRVMLVHFWATWCAPCADELRSLRAFYEGPYRERQLPGRGLVLLTVSNDVRSQDLDHFLAEQQLPFPVIVDSLSALNEQLELDAIPGTVVIGRDGEVIARWIGAVDWQSEALLARLESYLER